MPVNPRAKLLRKVDASVMHNAQRPFMPGTPIVRGSVGILAQPHLRRPHFARNFRFFDASIVLVNSGTLTLDAGAFHMTLDAPLTLLAVAQDVRADTRKNPGSGDGTFRSILLTFAPEVILEFYQRHDNAQPLSAPVTCFHAVAVDADLADTLSYCVRGMSTEQVSDHEQKHRLIGLLLALAGRGCFFPRPTTQRIGDRLKGLLSPMPQRRWTTATAARELAMSEATLRRRLASENLRFETLLLDIRMHHAMALLQTTTWSIPQIAEASGYRASSRFALRFRERFGCPPSQAR